MAENRQTLLVTGASGHMGRSAIELLLESNAVNAGQIVATTRSPEKLADLAQRGVIVRQADFNDPASLVKAFEGVDRLLLISTDAVDLAGTRLKQHVAAVKAAEEAGVKHIVYTSLINPGPDSPILLAPDHYGTEQALASSKLGWTVLRNNVYTETLIGGINRAIQMGQLFSAAADGKIAYITREDCTRAAVAALVADFDGRRVLDITGPESVSQADLAAIAGKIGGKQVTYIPIPLESLIQAIESAGLPRPVAEIYASFDTAAAQGQLAGVTSTFEELTGRKPQRVEDFLVEHRAVLV